MKPRELLVAAVAAALFLSPVLAGIPTLHLGTDVLNDAEIRRIEDGKVVIAYQGGLGTFALAAFSEPEQKQILKELHMSAEMFEKKRVDDQSRKARAVAATQQAEAERQLKATLAGAEQAKQEEAVRQQQQQQDATDKDRIAKGQVKVDGRWFNKQTCQQCGGTGGRTVIIPAETVLDDDSRGPIMANGGGFMRQRAVRLPPTSTFVKCTACDGRGGFLTEVK